MEPTHQQLDQLDLEGVREAITRQLDPRRVEVSLSGDLAMPQLEDLALRYLGTVPVPRGEDRRSLPEPDIHSLDTHVLGKARQLGVFLADTDERAMGYIAGSAPNDWGVYADGRTLGEKLLEKRSGQFNGASAHRAHPMFGHVALQVLTEVSFIVFSHKHINSC